MSVTSAVHHVSISPYELIASALLSNHAATAVRMLTSSIANPSPSPQAIALQLGVFDPIGAESQGRGVFDAVRTDTTLSMLAACRTVARNGNGPGHAKSYTAVHGEYHIKIDEPSILHSEWCHDTNGPGTSGQLRLRKLVNGNFQDFKSFDQLAPLGEQCEIETIDRLMISALIEARSCERFEILSRRCVEEELARVYGSLWASEKGHYLSFIDLARQVASRSEIDHDVEARWRDMLESEARIIQAPRPGPRMHSWCS